MMRRFMIESVKYWINEYHIDGFRFDLMGVHDIETMNQIRKAVDEIDPTIFIYGEGWSAGECAYPVEKLAVKANTRQLDRIAACRAAWRGGESEVWHRWRHRPSAGGYDQGELLQAGMDQQSHSADILCELP